MNALKKVSELQRERIKELVALNNIDEILDAIDKLPLLAREKVVLKALTSKELIGGQVGNTAREILSEIRKSEGSKGQKIGIRIWTILNELLDRHLIQTTKGFPKLYTLNRESNPMYSIMYSFSFLEAMYDILFVLVKPKVGTKCVIAPSYGTFSNNYECLEIMIDMIGLAKKEIFLTTLVGQSLEEFPSYIYALGKAIERGIKIYYLLSEKVKSTRLRLLKDIGVNTKVVEEKLLLEFSIPNTGVFDGRHFMCVNKYEYFNEQKIRFGFWHKHNPKICINYTKAFWEVWNK